jgi:hypothetical protein
LASENGFVRVRDLFRALRSDEQLHGIVTSSSASGLFLLGFFTQVIDDDQLNYHRLTANLFEGETKSKCVRYPSVIANRPGRKRL